MIQGNFAYCFEKRAQEEEMEENIQEKEVSSFQIEKENISYPSYFSRKDVLRYKNATPLPLYEIPQGEDFKRTFKRSHLRLVKPNEKKEKSAFLPIFFFILTCFLITAHSFMENNTLWAISQNTLLRGDWWRPLTAVLLHADIGHLLANSVILALFGPTLYRFLGLWGFPLLPWALAAIANIITVAFYPPQTWLLGASGMTFAMMGLWLGIFLLHEKGLRFHQRVARIIAFTLIMIIPHEYDPSVSYLAHFSGFLLGFLSSFAVSLGKKKWGI